MESHKSNLLGQRFCYLAFARGCRTTKRSILGHVQCWETNITNLPSSPRGTNTPSSGSKTGRRPLSEIDPDAFNIRSRDTLWNTRPFLFKHAWDGYDYVSCPTLFFSPGGVQLTFQVVRHPPYPLLDPWMEALAWAGCNRVDKSSITEPKVIGEYSAVWFELECIWRRYMYGKLMVRGDWYVKRMSSCK